MAEKFRLERQGGFGRNVRIAFFRTFFSKKKVHNERRLRYIPFLITPARFANRKRRRNGTVNTSPMLFALPQWKQKTLASPPFLQAQKPRSTYNNPAPQAHLFSSIFSLIFYLKKIPAGAGIFIAFILPNKRQIRRQSEQQRRLQSPMRRYRRARGECLSGRQPRRTCPWAYVREFSRFSESASRRRS